MPVRIDSIGQVLLRKELKEYIKSLEPGDVVKGRVLENEKGEVTIKATNGQIIKASLATDVSLEEGQFIEMQVDDVLDDKVYASLQAVEKKPENTDKLLKGLIRSLGLSPTDGNLALARTLLKNNLPVTVENINNLLNQIKSSNTLAQASPQSIIGLMASGNDLRNTSLETLRKIAVHFEADMKQYLSDMEPDLEGEDEVDFGSESEEGDEISAGASRSNKSVAGLAEALVDEPIKTLKVEVEIPEAGLVDTKEDIQTEEFVNPKKEINVGPNMKEMAGTKSQKVEADFNESVAADIPADEVELFDKTNHRNKESFQVLDRKSVPKTFENISTAYQNAGAFVKFTEEGIEKLIAQNPSDFGAMKLSKMNGPNKTLAEQETMIREQLEMVGIDTNEEIDAFIKKTTELLSKLENVSLDKLAWLASKGIEATPANLEVLEHHMNNTNKLGTLIENLDTQLSTHSDPKLAELREVVSALLLKPMEMADGEQVTEKLRDLVKVSENIDLYLSRSGIHDPEIRNTLSNVKDNIDFMRQVNQFNNFLQVPIQMNDKKATAELYIYKEKSRSKLIDPENATILIALDLPKSGRIESMIHLSGRAVTATFRLEKSEVETAIRVGEKVLSERLEARGYQLLPLKTIRLDETFNLMKMEELIGNARIDRVHIDMKV